MIIEPKRILVLIRFDLANSFFMYDLGPLKNERAISKQTIAKVKQDVNLEGDKTMVGKENIAKSMKIAATPKKANPLV